MPIRYSPIRWLAQSLTHKQMSADADTLKWLQSSEESVDIYTA